MILKIENIILIYIFLKIIKKKLQSQSNMSLKLKIFIL
jgi:hypothetical protein